MSAPARSVLALALGAVALALAAGCRDDDGDDAEAAKGPPPPVQRFESRPDLQPPPVEVLTAARPGTTPGYLLLAPKMKVAQAGPMIVDDRGDVVWFKPLETKGVADFRVQRYGGRPVLTWWRGKAPMGVGDGYYVILDDSYHQIATVQAGNGMVGDVHDFLITARDTALITIYRRMPYDLSRLDGPRDGEIFEGVIQELDIATGRVLFEWRSSEHVDVEESYAKVPPASQGAKSAPYDYFHLNSVEEDADGGFILSARHTHAVYKISREDGRVVWRLGGKRSDFRHGPGATFALQHDARRQPDGTLTLFDNGKHQKGVRSRVLVLRLDEAAKRATLVRSYEHPRKLLSETQANAQFLPNGNVLVGWGSNPNVTELDARGRVLLELRFGGKGADSYRAYREQWAGFPADDPAVSVNAEDGKVRLRVSWNGATEVARWQVLAGANGQRLRSLGEFAKDGFETAIEVETREPYLSVRALSAGGIVLGTSKLVELGRAGEDGEDEEE